MPKSTANRADELLSAMRESSAPKKSVVRIASPKRPEVSPSELVAAAQRKLQQRQALEAANVARVRGLVDMKRRASDLKRASFNKPQPDPAGPNAGQKPSGPAVWVEAYTRADGTEVSGYWRTNPNPAQFDGTNPTDVIIAGALLPLELRNSIIRQAQAVAAALKAGGDVLVGKRAPTYQIGPDGKLISQIPVEIQAGGAAVAGVALTGSIPGMGGGVRGALGTGGGRPPLGHNGGPPLNVAADLDPLGLYSQALRAAKALPQAKGTPEQMLAMLKGAGVKDAEIQWTGLGDMLKGRKSVTQQEIIAHLEQNRVRTNELRLPSDVVGAAEFAGWSLDPYNPTYRERLLQWQRLGRDELDNERRQAVAELRRLREQKADPALIEAAAARADALEKELWARFPELPNSHWSESGVFVHARTSTQTVANEGAGLKPGDQVHHVDEIQSDWAEGFRKAKNLQAAEARFQRANENLTSARLEARRLLEKVEPGTDWSKAGSDVLQKRLQALAKEIAPETPEAAKPYADAAALLDLRSQEYKLAADARETAAPGSRRAIPGPFIESTSSWVDLALKTQLVEAARNPTIKGLTVVRGEDVAKRFGQMHIAPGVPAMQLRWVPEQQALYRVSDNRVWYTLEDYRGWTELRPEIRDLVKPAVEANPSRPVTIDIPEIPEKVTLYPEGRGNVEFYNKIVTQRLKESVRKLDPKAKVGTVEVGVAEPEFREGAPPIDPDVINGGKTYTVTAVQMTDKMRQKILSEGLPMFVNSPTAGPFGPMLMTPREQLDVEKRTEGQNQARQRREFRRALRRGNAT